VITHIASFTATDCANPSYISVNLEGARDLISITSREEEQRGQCGGSLKVYMTKSTFKAFVADLAKWCEANVDA
jgi:hypothetical protein